jgi:hypothetical protein
MTPLMTKLKAIAPVLLLALATLTRASSPASASRSAVHIRGSGTGTITLNPTTGAFTGEESGVSSHLGRYTLRLQGTSTRTADGTLTGDGTMRGAIRR